MMKTMIAMNMKTMKGNNEVFNIIEESLHNIIIHCLINKTLLM